ncbi:tetratricopeptide repeat protein [Nocardia sp. NPDC052112]|uniref:tetratricopeptide repeat protein n=1 Tax=Nocardia sp. NPDC052112 TaxID=3155646 RepID=UPI003429C42D
MTRSALGRAEVAVELGRLDEARRIIGEALVAHPDDPVLLERMADIAYRLDQTDDALRYANAAIAADPARIDAYLTAALAYDAYAMRAEAQRHARMATRLAPDNVAALLVLARLIANSATSDKPRAEARDALERATQLAPAHVGTHAHAAETYRRMHDSDAARRHVEAGLAEDPVHAELLQTRARLDFENVATRDKAVATLRGLLGSNPGNAGARRLLAEIMWRALIRLAAWVWFFAAAVVALSMWIPPVGMRVLTPALFVGVLGAWFGVFRKLSRQLPRGYMRKRLLRRPEALLALVIGLLSGFVADIGTLELRSGWWSEDIRGGYIVILIGVVGAALAHLLLFAAWGVRRDGESDRRAGEEFALLSVIIVIGGGLLLVGMFAALRHWARQPAAFGVFVAIVGMVVVTLLLEILLVQALERGWRMFDAYAGGVLLVAALMTLAIWWGLHQTATQTFHSDERTPVSTVPKSPSPIPTFHFTPPVLPPPAG